ncbi:MAG: 4-hydroxy-tetrahydrodipicolinate synthase [Clostridia bacterium]|nr:4-hydroxy-tetrahydrodipicolinate synthase [Clostridia bacterium]
MSRKRNLFFGSGCAIATPFRNGEIDYPAFGELISLQIRNGTDALIVLGTTGEAPTINENERREIILFAKEKIGGRIPLIIGTGTNSTEVSIRYTKMAYDLGADACLLVTPYYNKATPNGLYEHYKKVAQSVDIPLILYNVPTRTCVNIPLEIYERLKEIDNIVGIKEASPSVSYMSEIISLYGDYFDVYTGNDDLTYVNLSLGGSGVISVCANLIPSYMHQLCYEFKNGNIEKSRELSLKLIPLIREMFSEVNPVPVKEALSQMGLCLSDMRLPLTKSMRKEQITKVLKEYNLI